MTPRAVVFRPVFDKTGATILFDIFIDEVWHGSPRTVEQCDQYP